MAFPRYTFTQLGGQPGFLVSGARAINTLPDRAQVAGYAACEVPGTFDSIDQLAMAILWEILDGQAPTIIPLPFGVRSKALGLNNVFPSTVVGWSSSDGFSPQPSVWQRDGYGTLSTFPGASGAGMARAVNDDGYIVGYAYTAPDLKQGTPPQRHAFVVPPNGPMIDLQTNTGTTGESEAYGINNQGHVVGWSTAWSTTNSVVRQLCMWDLGNNYQYIQNAPMLVFAPALNGTSSVGFGINAGGLIAGAKGRESDGFDVSAMWRFQVGWIFGTVEANHIPSAAFSVNDHDVIVGTCGASSSSDQIAFICNLADQFVTDLNTLADNLNGCRLVRALGINNRGQITGDGYRSDGDWIAWLLTPS